MMALCDNDMRNALSVSLGTVVSTAGTVRGTDARSATVCITKCLVAFLQPQKMALRHASGFQLGCMKGPDLMCGVLRSSRGEEEEEPLPVLRTTMAIERGEKLRATL